MPSITFWNRLEPRPRSGDLAEALAARVRDPAWFLTRQWQLGEFQGEDAGSPAYLRMHCELAPIFGWQAKGAAAAPIAAGTPIEAGVTAEPSSPHDLTVAVEIGQELDRQLAARSSDDLRDAFLAAYPIAADPDDDPAAALLRALWRGRAL